MNKKFSTLVASFLLAGAFGTVDAQDVLNYGDFKEGNVYYLTQTKVTAPTTTISDYVKGLADGTTTTASVRPDLKDDVYYQWKAVKAGNDFGSTAMYKLQNMATGKFLQVGGADYVANAGTLTNYGGATATLPVLATIKTRVLTAAELNNMDAYKGGFSLQFIDGGQHKTAYSFIDNVFVEKNIKAYDAATMLANYANKGMVLLKVSGDWNGEYLYKNESRLANDGVTSYTQLTYLPDVVKKFRASKFIMLSNEKYSQFATNVSDPLSQAEGYKFEVVTGAEFVGKIVEKQDAPTSITTSKKHNEIETIGQNNTDWTSSSTTVWTFTQSVDALTSSVNRVYTNAMFTLTQKGTAAESCVNDLTIELKDAYTYSVVNGKVVYTNVATGSAETDKTPVFASVFDFEGQKYVCAKPTEASTQTHPAFVNNALVGVTVDPTIFLASKKIVNVVYYKDGKGTTGYNGKTWNPAQNTEKVLLAKFIDNTMPEGQWIVSYDWDNNKFTFTNLESEKASLTNVLLYDNGNGNYTAVDGTTEHFITLTDAVKPDTQFGYVDMTKEQLDNGFNISVITELLGNVYLKENHATDHKATFSQDKEQASVWRFNKFTEAKNYAANIEGSDTIRVINKYTVWNATDKKFEDKNDTIEALAYAIYNDYTREYLKYDANKKAYYSDVNTDANTISKGDLRSDDKVQKFVLKKKFDGLNLLPATIQDGGNDESQWADEKLIGSFSENKLTKDIEMYRVIDNDLFAVEPVSAPIYRTMAPALDTVKIFKDENNSDVLFEHNHFLAMEHVADVPDMKAAMYVDTAYVRNNAVKPQYLLVVGAKHVIDEEICEIPGHPIHRADTVFGRFLVNMVDSMRTVDGTAPHNNPYKWETYPKLAFIEGIHTHDALTLPSMNKTVDLSKNADDVAVFQFRYVDREAGSFLMETLTKDAAGNATTGWVKWLNGTPVVVDKIELAEVLNLAETSEAPTANEGVEVSEVSVVAANGAVIVKGAEGKNVAVSNILGQTIANTVVSSDNATIAVPAGIVVVAVEGEEAVKVVVK